MTLQHLIPLKQHCEQCGITLNQLAMLVCIEAQPQTCTSIASQLAVTGAAITGQIDALTAKGYLTAVVDGKDRRTKKVTPTKKGFDLISTAQKLAA